MLGPLLQAVRRQRPLVHCITNYVAANDCANILLACGASPIMADDPQETGEITAHCAGLTLNLGTLHVDRIDGMLAAGRTANQLGRPVLLDPVGVGASRLRTDTAQQLLREIRFAAIRGNASEIQALALGTENRGGVDAAPTGCAGQSTPAQAAALARALAEKTGAVIIVTGAADIVADHSTVFCVHGGHPMMRYVTGAGCQLSAMTTAYLAASPHQPLAACLASVCAMGVCGQLAYHDLAPGEGSGSYRSRILDAVYHLTPERLEELAHYELYP